MAPIGLFRPAFIPQRITALHLLACNGTDNSRVSPHIIQAIWSVAINDILSMVVDISI